MSQPHAPTDDRHGPHYEIRLQGHLDPRWAAWFDGLTLTRESDGTTVIHGSVVDQAALHGLLGKVRDLGLPWTTEGGDHRLNRQINSPTIHERGSVASKNESLDRIQ
jgi:hypothetical protein